MQLSMYRGLSSLALLMVGCVWVLLGCTGFVANPAQSVDAAGTVSGKVVFEGKAPKMRPLPVEADPACAALHKTEPLLTDFLILGEGQSMANVFVQVMNPPAGDYPVPTETVDMSQHGCQYNPHVFAVRVGQTLRILNPDGLRHNVHFMPKVNKEFNRAMAQNKREITYVPKVAEPIFDIKCDVHSWMKAHCAIMDHPFYQVTGIDGTFSIPNLPPGEYKIQAWHEVLGTQTGTVTVKDGEEAKIDFTYKRPTRPRQ